MPEIIKYPTSALIRWKIIDILQFLFWHLANVGRHLFWHLSSTSAPSLKQHWKIFHLPGTNAMQWIEVIATNSMYYCWNRADCTYISCKCTHTCARSCTHTSYMFMRRKLRIVHQNLTAEDTISDNLLIWNQIRKLTQDLHWDKFACFMNTPFWYKSIISSQSALTSKFTWYFPYCWYILFPQTVSFIIRKIRNLPQDLR